MAFRLLNFDVGFPVTRIDWLTGPTSRQSGSNTSVVGIEQGFSTYGDTVALRLNIALAQDARARRQRGFITGMQSGNAFRFNYKDPDIMSPEEAGVVGQFTDQPWSNGEPWSNGKLWTASYPDVLLADAVAFDEGVVSLVDTHWGHTAGLGDIISFTPNYFGIHIITQVIEPGTYRFWPRIRKIMSPDDEARCTLYPTVVMKPASLESSQWSRNADAQEEISIDCIEVPDYYVREWYTD